MIDTKLPLGALLLVTGFLFVVSVAHGKTPQPPDGFQSIFNGKDLAGWEGSSDFWGVQDGYLIGVTVGSLTFNRFII